MFSKSLRERLRSVAVELTVVEACLFGLVSVGGIVALYFTVAAYTVGEVDAELLAQQKALAEFADWQNAGSLEQEFLEDARDRGRADCFLCLYSRAGQRLTSSDMTAWPTIAFQPAWLAALARTDHPLLRTVPLRDKRGRARVLVAHVAPDRILVMGLSMQEEYSFLRQFRRRALAAIAGMLVAGIVASWIMARRAMQGVEQVTGAAARIAAGEFGDRVEEAHFGAEIARLARTFNRMAEQIQKLMASTREVNDHIAHDLRSPLTRIRGLAEMAVLGKTSLGEYAEVAGSIVEECDRLLGLINTMLDISEAETGLGRLTLASVDSGEVVRKAVELFQLVAEEKGVALRWDGGAAAVPPIQADVRKIQRAVANLVDNALKYTERGGSVTVRLERSTDGVRISVRDTGCGIPERELPLIFARFYRGDRSRNQPGNGLGLSLALAVARAHGGRITVDSQAGQGSTFTLILPAAPESNLTKG